MSVDILIPRQALSWLFAALSVFLTVGRFWIRISIIRSLSWDDAVHLLGLLFLLAQISIVTAAASMMYDLDEYDVNPTGEQITLLFHLDVAGLVMTWSCVYAVKAAFLLLYRRIFHISKAFTRVWWITSIYVLVTFGVLLVGSLTQCGSAPELGDLGMVL